MTDGKEHEPEERRLREAVAVEADAEHVHAEPRPARDDVAEDSAVHEAAFADESAPAQVQDEGVPQNDDERAVFLRVPTPEAAPRLICPDAAEHGADEAEQRGGSW